MILRSAPNEVPQSPDLSGVAPGLPTRSAPFPGASVTLERRRPQSLEAYDAWYVERGAVDLFAVSLVGGGDSGLRRHLGRVEAGGIVVGLGASTSPGGQGVLMVALSDTQAVKGSFHGLSKTAEETSGEARVRALMDGWIRTLSAAFCVAPPRAAQLIVPGRQLDAAATKVIGAGETLIWVKQVEGSSRVAARSDLSVEAPDEFPLAAPLWIEVQPASRLSSESATAVPWDALHTGVLCLGRLFLAQLDTLAREDQSRQVTRGQSLRVTAQTTLQDACVRLASSLRGSPRVAAPALLDRNGNERGDPLLACCRVVGESLGVAVRPAVEGELAQSKKDPLGAIMRASRLRSRKVALRGQWWKQDHGPLVACIEDGKRPAALVWDGRRYRLLTPDANVPGAVALSAGTIVSQKVAATLLPFAQMIYRPFPEMALSVRDLLAFAVRGCRRDVLGVVLMAAAIALLGVFPAFATGVMFNRIIPGAEIDQLVQVTILLIVCAVTTSAFTVARSLALLRVQSRLGATVQAAVWDRLLRAPLAFFRPFTAGDLAVRAMSIDAIQQILSGTTIGAIMGGIFSLTNVFMMFQINTPMAWRAITLLGVAVAVTGAGGVLQRRPQGEVLRLQAKTSGLVLQLLTAIGKLRVAGAEPRAFALWVERFSEQRRLQISVRRLGSALGSFNAAFPVLAQGLIFWVALPALHNGSMRTGDLLAFSAAFGSCLVALLGTCTAVVAALGAIPLYEQARPILETAPEVSFGRSDPGPLSGDIEAQHMVFRYASDGPPALRDVSFRIAPGEFVAFVGPSGSGKSTILKLLLGFEKLESGGIHYDGQDLSGLDIQEVRRQMGVVLQTGRLTAGDLFTNIVGSKSATMEQVWEAAEMAGIADDIRAMPMMMHTVVSENAATLSGGQRQRLMIARAIVHRPRILLFDEATSALDNRTQALVSASLERMRATRIVVAHRLSTIARADRIFVVEKGRITQCGSYDELMRQAGAFAELARRQIV